MKIAYLCADFGIPIQGDKGASVHVRAVVAALTAQGHDVRVLTPTPGAGNPLGAPLLTVAPDGLPAACGRVVGALTRGRAPRLVKETREVAYNLTLYQQAWARFRSWRPDAIYERYSLFTVAGLALARRLGVPHLLEVNAPLRLERARTKGLVLEPVARFVERRLYSRSDAVLVVSEALRAYARERGAVATRTRVLPNGVDTTRFHPSVDGRAARARWGLAQDALVVGFAGSLKPWHGVETLLDAFAALRAHTPTARLLVIGTGPQEAAVRARATDLRLGDSVVFTGAVAHAAMPGLLAALDIGVAPYLAVPDFYFSPLKLYEYMAAGVAVVASDAGAIATLVRAGETGLLCPPGDADALAGALACLASDPTLRARLGAAARAEAERHTWAVNACVIAGLASAARDDHGAGAVGRQTLGGRRT